MSQSLDDDFELFTSMRYDSALIRASWKPSLDEPCSPFLLFSYHLDRLREAVQHFQWEDELGITTGDPTLHQHIHQQIEELIRSEEHGSGMKSLRVRSIPLLNH